MAAEFDDDSARTIRTHWFRYLDKIEPDSADLHRYCVRLAGNVWDGEDLMQETLLKGFGMAARGDFHGPDSPVQNVRAYLFRTATNLWLDLKRREHWLEPLTEEAVDSQSNPDPILNRQALQRGLSRTSPREFCALILKDVFDYSLIEIADFVGTTSGTIKSALSRAREKMKSANAAQKKAGNLQEVDEDKRALATAFVEALNARDVERITSLLHDTLKIDVCNVGGGRGKHGIWTEKSVAGVCARYEEYDGEPIVLLFYNNEPALGGIVRLQGDEGIVTRLLDYSYAEHTLCAVATALGLDYARHGWHQDESELKGMIATTFLPWRH